MLRVDKQQQEEEFQEADILWPDAAQDLELPQMYYSLVDADEGDDYYSGQHRPVKLRGRQKASSPIDIPAPKVSAAGAKGARALAGFSKFGQTLAGAGGGSVFVGSHVFVPPHVIIDHRRAKREKAMMMLVVPKGRARTMVIRE
ncbi:hypothetical protein E2562_034034 [Oryza meyeriana var. granulata]|uniref:Uncharacterized protein n=1 Tax=Oryza meyeriana var. granulata TaxID=110450 RepID=A0A6G1E546_9ORYZ|nr:hypothetical protein E2562_034034 [Oryza meyeriana var. granulata]